MRDSDGFVGFPPTAVCVQTAFKLCFQEHVSEVLGQFAETAVNDMVLHLFSRLSELTQVSSSHQHHQLCLLLFGVVGKG